jgi:hypothetical protein
MINEWRKSRPPRGSCWWLGNCPLISAPNQNKGVTMKCRQSFLIAFLVALASATRVSAQLPIPTFGLAGGVSHFDLSGTGSAPIASLRLDLPLFPLIAEASLSAFRPMEQNGVQRSYIIPEAQLQYQLFPMFIRPYVGVGAGYFRAITGPDPHRNDVTYSASAGIRAGFPTLPFSVRTEFRVRGIGSGFAGSATEWTIGISR